MTPQRVFVCPNCHEWKPLFKGTEVEIAFYAPLPAQDVSMQFSPNWRRVFQPILICDDCLTKVDSHA